MLRGIGKAAASAATSRGVYGIGWFQPSTAKIGHSQPAGVNLRVEADEWEIAGLHESDLRDHLVFDIPPSLEEVDAASSDLCSIAGFGLATNVESDAGTWPLSPKEESISSSRASGIPESPHVQSGVDWIEPCLVKSGGGRVQVSTRNPVIEALRLFQENTDVQKVVKSLASDSNLWCAVLNNPAVKELRQKLVENECGCLDVQNGSEKDQYLPTFGKQFADVLGRMKKTIFDIINGLLSFVDKKVSSEKEKDGDHLTRNIRSCVVLAIIMLVMIICKRSSSN